EGFPRRPRRARVRLARRVVPRARAAPPRGCLRLSARPRRCPERRGDMIELAAAAVLAAAAPALSPQSFRYVRALRSAGAGPVELVPDGPLFAHARPDFSDLRVVDASGTQVPWRQAPEPAAGVERRLEVLDSGRRAGAAVARVDLGPGHRIVDRVTLSVPDRRFVGSVTVL